MSEDVSGPRLQRIIKDTNASITISNPDHQPRELIDRLMVVSGNITQKEDAIFAVIDVMRANLNLRSSEEGTFVMLVPEPVSPMIIGRRGSTIREIREDTRCDIELEENAVAGTKCLPIILRGNFETTKRAVKQIQKVVSEYISRGKSPAIDFEAPGFSALSQVNTPVVASVEPRPVVLTAAHIPTRILVNSDCAGFLIGRGGQGLSRIRSESRADIIVSKQMRSGDREDRFVIITGNSKVRAAAADLVITHVREHQKCKSGERSDFTLVVPDVTTSKIIGKAGKTIKEIRSLCHADIDVGERNLPGTQDRPVAIRADFDGLAKAVARVTELVDEAATIANMKARDFEVPGYLASK